MRAGHTEACCDLARLAGLTPVGGAVRDHERRRHDGAAARPDRVRAAHELKIGTIADLIDHRSRNESLVERDRRAPADDGAAARFRLVAYRDQSTDATHLALVRGPLSPDTETLVRVHEPLSVMDLLDTGQHVAFVDDRRPRSPPSPKQAAA